ncbi:MAG: hypothetical protein ACLRMZ_21520 [Blautia marasmi]
MMCWICSVTEDDIAEEAKNLVNRRLFISAYAEANNIEVTEEEYVNYVNEYADYYGESPADFETLYTGNACKCPL